MDGLRKPFFVAALVLIALVVLMELGSPWVARTKVAASDAAQQARSVRGLEGSSSSPANASASLSTESPPGLGIPKMVLLDGLVAWTALMMGLPILLGDRIHGRLVGILSVIVGFLAALGSIILIFATLAEVLLMVALFLAAPFGTIAYLAEWGFFRVGTAATILGCLLTLKLGFGACLLLAQQRFLQNKGLVLILVTSLVANLVISFLHGFVPQPLVSITDGIGALVALVLALIWAILMLIFGLISAIKAIT